MKRRLAWAIVLVGALVMAALGHLSGLSKEPRPVAPQVARRSAVEAASALRLPFLANEGQRGDRRIRYYAPTFGGAVAVDEDGGLIYALVTASGQGGRGSAVCYLRESLVGAGPIEPVGRDPQDTRVHEYRGVDAAQWRKDIPSFRSVSLGQVYPGVQLDLQLRGDRVEKVFTIAPGADAGQVRIAVEGARGLQVTDAGELQVETLLGPVLFSKPIAYQERQGGRDYVDAAYRLEGDHYALAVGSYDTSRPLYIDPLLASTFVGGGGSDKGYAVALDLSGNVYVVGETTSLPLAPETNVYTTTAESQAEVLVAKLDAGLEHLLASALIGGQGDDIGKSLTIDGSAGTVYVGGATSSVDYPTTNGAHSRVFNGEVDAFVTALSSDLTLQASTYLGGEDAEEIQALVLSGGLLYVGGYSGSAGFPSGAAVHGPCGYNDVFVAALTADLGAVSHAARLGGASTEKDISMAMDGGGAVYLTGYTTSDDYPTTGGPGRAGTTDGFVSKLTANLQTMPASRLIGGNETDLPQGLAVLGATVYVAGYTNSTNLGLGQSAFGTHWGSSGGMDGYVWALDTALADIVGGTYLPGSGDADYIMGVAAGQVEGSPVVYVVGYSSSSDFLGGSNTTNGSSDGVLVRLNGELSAVESWSHIGGSGWDDLFGLALGTGGEVYSAGSSRSGDFPMPVGVSPYDPIYGGDSDDVVVRLLSDLVVGPTGTPVTPQPSATPTLSPTVTRTPSITPTPSNTPVPSNTPTDTATPTQTNTPTETATPSQTPTLTSTPTDTPTPTDTSTPTQTPTATETSTPTTTPTETHTPTATPTSTPTPLPLILRGIVCDGSRMPPDDRVANATVSLYTCYPGTVLTVTTESDGSFELVVPAVYTDTCAELMLEVTAPGYLASSYQDEPAWFVACPPDFYWVIMPGPNPPTPTPTATAVPTATVTPAGNQRRVWLPLVVRE
ncbi:MAG: DUF7948 domain-containing protein [Anaerolineae bacterium]